MSPTRDLTRPDGLEAVRADPGDIPAAPAAVSVLEAVRQEREHDAWADGIYLDIPSYTTLVARYRVVDVLTEGKQIADGVKGQQSDRERLIYGAMDVLIRGCVGLYVRQPDGSLAQAIDDDGDPILYDHRLAQALGIQAMTAREVLEAVFRGNHAALMAHAEEHARWMQNPQAGGLGEG